MQSIVDIIKAGAAAAMTIEQIIVNELAEWRNSEERRSMLDAERYYRMRPDVLNKKRTAIGEDGAMYDVKLLANNRLVHGFFRKLVDQKVGYLLSKPISIKTNNKTYQDLLTSRFVDNKSFLRLLKSLGKEAIKKGKAWLHVYYNELGDLCFKLLPSEEIFPLWKDAAHTELDAAIRTYEIEVYSGTSKQRVTKVEYWDTTGVKRYVLEDGGRLIPDVEVEQETESHFVGVDAEGKETRLNWERVPFICFKYNELEQSLLELIRSLVDDYDSKKSSNSDNIDDLPNSIFVVTNYDGTDLGEFRRNISTYRAAKVTDDGGIDTISIEIDTEAYTKHLEQNRKDIYEFGRGVDTQSEKFGQSPSGIALKFLYADLDMDANEIETEFQAALEQLLWFVDTDLANSGVGDFADEPVEFVFNRDIVINETDSINNAKSSVGVISDETIVANHPWTTDTKSELDRIAKQKQQAFEEAQAYGGLGGNKDDPTAGSGAGTG